MPPFYLDTVVAIGVGDDPTTRQWVGTGFLYGQADPKAAANGYLLWLITNKHVVRGRDAIYVKFNSSAAPNSEDYKVELVAKNRKTLWVGHPEDKVDIAAIYLNAGVPHPTES